MRVGHGEKHTSQWLRFKVNIKPIAKRVTTNPYVYFFIQSSICFHVEQFGCTVSHGTLLCCNILIADTSASNADMYPMELIYLLHQCLGSVCDRNPCLDCASKVHKNRSPVVCYHDIPEGIQHPEFLDINIILRTQALNLCVRKALILPSLALRSHSHVPESSTAPHLHQRQHLPHPLPCV